MLTAAGLDGNRRHVHEVVGGRCSGDPPEDPARERSESGGERAPGEQGDPKPRESAHVCVPDEAGSDRLLHSSRTGFILTP